MLGLRQVVRLSLKVAAGSSINVTASFPQRYPESLYRFAANTHAFRRFTTENNLKLDDNKIDNDLKTPTKHYLGKIEQRLAIQFVCKKCQTKNSKTMTKLAYEKGVVIIRCDGCQNNHLIADNLGWFGSNSKKRNIEKIMAMNGEKVKRLNAYGNEIFEVVEKELLSEIKLNKEVDN